MKPDKRMSRALRGTRGELLRTLRRGKKTVGELSRQLGITPNAVRAQLAALGSEGLVRQSGQRSAVRKPEFLFEITELGEQLFPKAYGALLNHLLDELRGRMEEDDHRAVFEHVAHRLSLELGRSGKNTPLDVRIRMAVDAVETLGGAITVRADDGTHELRGASCPFAPVTEGHPEICHLVETLLADISGLTVSECCERSEGAARCVFRLRKN